MRWVPRSRRFPSYAFWLIVLITVWLVEKVPVSFWMRLLILVVVAFPIDFLEKHRLVFGEQSEDKQD